MCYAVVATRPRPPFTTLWVSLACCGGSTVSYRLNRGCKALQVSTFTAVEHCEMTCIELTCILQCIAFAVQVSGDVASC